jgi:hypothetical protein
MFLCFVLLTMQSKDEVTDELRDLYHIRPGGSDGLAGDFLSQ